MTLRARVEYCRRRLVDPRTPAEDLAVWLAEYDGLRVGAGVLADLDCPDAYLTDGRLRERFEQAREDGYLLSLLEAGGTPPNKTS